MTDEAHVDGQRRDSIIVTLNQQEYCYTQEQLGVDMDTPDDRLLTAVRGIIGEELGGRMVDESGVDTFAVRRAMNTNNLYVYPKTGYGK